MIFFLTLWICCLLMPIVKGYNKALFIICGLWLLWHWKSKQNFFPLGSLKLPLIAFFGWLCVSTLTAVDPRGAVEELFQWGVGILAFLMFIDIVRSRTQIILLALAFTLGNSYLGIASLIEYFSGVYRIGGPTGAWPTVLGCYLGFALPWTLCLFYGTQNSNLRFLIGLVILLLVFALGGTLTRSALAGFLISLVVLSNYLIRQGKWRFQTLLVGLSALLLFFPAFLTRLSMIGSETIGNISFSRPVFWEQSLSLLNEDLRILTGIGMKGSFQLVFRELPVTLIDGHFSKLDHAHNFMIHYLVAWGLPGLLAYLWFLGSYVKKAVESFRANPSRLGQWIQWVALATLIGFWVAELFDLSVHYRTNMICYWWTLAMGIVGGKLASPPYAISNTKSQQ